MRRSLLLRLAVCAGISLLMLLVANIRQAPLLRRALAPLVLRGLDEANPSTATTAAPPTMPRSPTTVPADMAAAAATALAPRQGLDEALLSDAAAATALARALPQECSSTGVPAAIAAYAAWHAGKMAFLRAAHGNVSAARALQAAGGDTDAPMSLAVYGRSPGGGWGDRVPAIVSLFLFALRYRRVFLLDYPAIYPWLASPFFDWTLNATALPELAAHLAREPALVLFTCERSETCLWSSAAPDARFAAAAALAPHLVSNRGAWSAGTLDAHFDWLEAFAGGRPACVHQALFRPTPALLALPAVGDMERHFAAARAAGARIVGVHVRAGDAAMLVEAEAEVRGAAAAATATVVREPSTPTAGEAEARIAALAGRDGPAVLGLLAALDSGSSSISSSSSRGDGSSNSSSSSSSSSPAVVYLSSDSVELRRAVQARYPRALVSASRPVHVGSDAHDYRTAALRASAAARAITDEVAARETLADWWLLARADVRAAGNRLTSGFVRSATLASATGAFHADGPDDCMPGARALCCGVGAGHNASARCFRSIGSGT